jgi:hypothetical protein
MCTKADELDMLVRACKVFDPSMQVFALKKKTFEAKVKELTEN